jgi:hypothetical protein
LAEQAERQRRQAREAADPVERKRAATRAVKAEERTSALHLDTEAPTDVAMRNTLLVGGGHPRRDQVGG